MANFELLFKVLSKLGKSQKKDLNDACIFNLLQNNYTCPIIIA